MFFLPNLLFYGCKTWCNNIFDKNNNMYHNIHFKHKLLRENGINCTKVINFLLLTDFNKHIKKYEKLYN